MGRFLPDPKLKLRQQLHEVMRFKHLSIRTEESYWHWIRRYILFHGKRHPREMGAAEVQSFLTHLAAEENVAAVTQAQALNALGPRCAQSARLTNRRPGHPIQSLNLSLRRKDGHPGVLRLVTLKRRERRAPCRGDF